MTLCTSLHRRWSRCQLHFTHVLRPVTRQYARRRSTNCCQKHLAPLLVLLLVLICLAKKLSINRSVASGNPLTMSLSLWRALSRQIGPWQLIVNSFCLVSHRAKRDPELLWSALCLYIILQEITFLYHKSTFLYHFIPKQRYNKQLVFYQQVSAQFLQNWSVDLNSVFNRKIRVKLVIAVGNVNVITTPSV